MVVPWVVHLVDLRVVHLAYLKAEQKAEKRVGETVDLMVDKMVDLWVAESADQRAEWTAEPLVVLKVARSVDL